MYKLKQLPEDFIVKELSNIPIKEHGRYLYFLLRKRNRNTLDVLKELAKLFHLPEKQFGFAGSKDKQAVTEQMCSVYGVSKEKFFGATIKDASLEFLGYGDNPISLGDLEGNKFEIVVRNLEPNTKVKAVEFIPNYFDEQRFSENNMEIGKHILRKEFQKAAVLIGDKEIKSHLTEKPNDAVGALKKLPIRLLRLYVNAYQSYLWNETLARYLRSKTTALREVEYSLGKFVFVSAPERFSDLKIPLVGFGGEDLIPNKELKEIITKLLQEEKLTYADFIIKQIPELTLEGELRNAFVEVRNLKVGKLETDELNSEKNKVKVSFTLGKGSYATMAIRAMVS